VASCMLASYYAKLNFISEISVQYVPLVQSVDIPCNNLYVYSYYVRLKPLKQKISIVIIFTTCHAIHFPQLTTVLPTPPHHPTHHVTDMQCQCLQR